MTLHWFCDGWSHMWMVMDGPIKRMHYVRQVFSVTYVNVTQYQKRYILSTFEKNDIFALSNRRFNKLSNDTKFVKIEVILFESTTFTKCEFPLFSLYFTHCFVHYLRISLNWITYFQITFHVHWHQHLSPAAELHMPQLMFHVSWCRQQLMVCTYLYGERK